MRLATVGSLSLLGMALTSVSVWALTPPISPPISSEGSAAWRGAAASITNAKVDPAVGSKADPAGASLGAWVGGLAGKADFADGSTVRVEGRLGHATLSTAAGETFLYLDARTTDDDTSEVQVPLNLAIVMDRSRSMEGQRMRNAVDAARGMVSRLRDGDTVTIVTYNTVAEVVVPKTRIDDRSRRDVLGALLDVPAQGHTCISCGIETALDHMGTEPGAVSRMLLLSDGEANAGVRDEAGFRALAERAYAREVAVSTIGVDVDYNANIMGTVAQSSNGRHYFVEKASDLAGIFDEELQGLVHTVAKDARFEIDLGPGVQVAQVYDRTFTREGDRLVVPLGSFAVKDERTLLVRLRVPEGTDPTEVARVRLSYEDLVTHERAQPGGTLVAQRTTDAAAVSELDALVETRLGRADASSALELANEQFQRGETEDAQRTIEDNRGRIHNRRAAVRTKGVTPGTLDRLDRDFESQLEVLDKAEKGFNSAASAQPAEPAASVEGRKQVRSNKDEALELEL